MLMKIIDKSCIDIVSMFQNPFNSVSYSIIGDDQAQNRFFINPSSGIITTSGQSLTNDVNSFYTVSRYVAFF